MSDDQIFALFVWAGGSVSLALSFVADLVTWGNPLFPATISGPLFGLWFGYGLGWMRVRLKTGRP